MRPLRLRTLKFAALLWASSVPETLAARGDCLQSSLDHLQAASPNGMAIYRSISQPKFFEGWVRCDDAQFNLPTAVHEATHFITAETDAFPMMGGGAIKRPHEVSGFFSPFRLAKRFRVSTFAKIYLRRGKASSATDFLYLLDELNAYTHDLNTAVDLKDLTRADVAVDHRDGLAAMMAFVAVYAQTAKASEPTTWRGLREPPVARVIVELWGQAERVMASSCGIPNFGFADTDYIRQYCAPSARAALEEILGRALVCPTACLTGTPGTGAADGGGDTALSREPPSSVAAPRAGEGPTK